MNAPKRQLSSADILLLTALIASMIAATASEYRMLIVIVSAATVVVTNTARMENRNRGRIGRLECSMSYYALSPRIKFSIGFPGRVTPLEVERSPYVPRRTQHDT
jgi:hypothetical protein